MKILEFFKNRKFVRLLTVGLAVLVSVVTCLSVMLSSYVSYNDYYNALMKEKEHQKYLNSLPLTLKSITAALNEGKEYYTDGLAAPVTEDFSVTAHFSEKGNDFDKILSSTDFDIVVPEDFAENGGIIQVNYSYVPEKDNETDPDPEPLTASVDVDVALTRVALRRLEVKELPYRVYYSDDMPFSLDGMSCTAYYNNGRAVEVPASALKANVTDKLSAGTESVPVAFSLDDVTLTADVPVKVEAKASYAEKKMLSVQTEGEIKVTEGTRLSTVRVPVRATYASGNRLLLEEGEYTVNGNTENASFLYNCILTVASAENPAVSTRTAAAVCYAKEAEATTLKNCTSAVVDEYAEGAKIGQATVVNTFDGNASFSFTIPSTGVTKGKFYLRLANTGNEAVSLGNVLSMKVNGTSFYVSKELKASSNGGNCVFADYLLPSTVLRNGNNTVEISVKSGATLAIDRLSYETKYEGTFYSNVDEYITFNETPVFTSKKAIEWNSAYRAYMHGLCTDGEYLYAASTSWGGSRDIVVKKYNVKTGELVAASPATVVKSSEVCAGVTYVDGKIVTFMSDGTEYAIDASLSGSWQEYKGFDFEGYENLVIRDAAYLNESESVALRSGGVVYLFDKTGEKVASVTLGGENGLDLMHCSMTNDYIYAVYSKDGSFQPVVRTYDYKGNLIRRFVVENSTAVMGSVVQATASTNVQGVTTIGDSLYFSVLKFGGQNGGDQAMILRADYPEISEKLEYTLSYGEYLAETQAKGVAGTATAKGIDGNIGTIEGTKGYAMGAVSDGEYIYFADNTSGNAATTLYKYDTALGKVIATTASFEVAAGGESGDNSRLFIKDGVLYCIPHPSTTDKNKLAAIKLSDFVDKANVSFVDSPFTAANIGTANVKGATYEAAVDRYAVLLYGSRLTILSGDGSVIKKDIVTSGVGSVTSDEKYIYVNNTANFQTSCNVEVYDWDGNKVGAFAFTGVTLGTSNGSAVGYNVQCLFTHKGETYATVCSWTGGYQGMHVWKVSMDLSVFD